MLVEIMRREGKPSDRVLADVGGLSLPDDHESPGGIWLSEVWQRVENLREEDIHFAYELEDRIMEEADAAIPPYTHNLWMVWVDLQGYNSDEADEIIREVSPRHDLRLGMQQMEAIPQMTLYYAARRILERYT